MRPGDGRRDGLSRADASNIAIDAPDQANVFLLAGVLRPGGVVRADGSVDVGLLRDVIGARAATMPRLSQRVLRQGRHLVWEPCVLDLDRQVRMLSPVAGLAGFESLCAELIVTPLPTGLPLWEVLLVPGVTSDAPGVILRIHHALADGLAAVRIVDALFDPVAGKGTPGVPPHPARPPARRGVIAAAVAGVRRTAAMFRHAVPRTILLGPLGRRRGLAFAAVDLDGVRRGAEVAGATLNDALLAALAHAIRTVLTEAGEVLPDSLPVSVPVALPHRDGSGNAVGVMLVPLPMGVLETRDRLHRVAALTATGKVEARAQGMLEVMRTRWGAALFARFARHQRLVAGFVTNVPGPVEARSLGGALVERAWPVTTLQGNVRLGVSALSYAGELFCSIHCDVAGPDPRAIRSELRREFRRIIDLGRS